MQPSPLHQLESYDYELPADRIAQHPVSPRDQSKLLVLSRAHRAFSDHIFHELPQLLNAGDMIVINQTKVLAARFQADKGEVLLVRELEKNCWDCLVHPGKSFKPNTSLKFDADVSGKVLSLSRTGRIIYFEGDLSSFMENHGQVPLPPYIKRKTVENDRTDYQTVYARNPGSIAAPTAGLHFTRRTFRNLANRNVQVARLTLHVGPGTFRPVKSDDITRHQMDAEYYHCRKSTWQRIQSAKRVVAVGTTTTRALETIAVTGQTSGSTDFFIFPGYQFQLVGGLLTNFHLPKSTLLMLVSAFAGYEFLREAYAHAMDSDYRFYSYGDAMLIL